MGRSGKSTDFLKECIADSLLGLMQQKPYDKISLQEITQNAGVGRATYYRNFSSKSEILTFKLVRMWQRWAQEHQLDGKGRYTLRNAADFFGFCYSIRDIHRTICQAGMQSAAYEAFYQILMPLCGPSTEDSYRFRFFCYGVYGLLDEWAKRDYRESPREMTDIFYNIVAVRGRE